MVGVRDNARFLKVPILFSQHEHRTLTGQKLYFKRVLPLFSKPYICISHQGKQDLAKSIARKLKAFKNSSPNTKFIIVHDQDSHDCQKLKKELGEICQNASDAQVLIVSGGKI